MANNWVTFMVGQKHHSAKMMKENNNMFDGVIVSTKLTSISCYQPTIGIQTYM